MINNKLGHIEPVHRYFMNDSIQDVAVIYNAVHYDRVSDRNFIKVHVHS